MLYVRNIQEGLSKADPAGAATYAKNAEAYTAELKKLDDWIKEQVARVPVARRVLVTSHDCFGYFADRYGFKIVGTIVPSVSTDASPSARQIAQLIDRIRAAHAPAVFVEAQTNPQLAAAGRPGDRREGRQRSLPGIHHRSGRAGADLSENDAA